MVEQVETLVAEQDWRPGRWTRIGWIATDSVEKDGIEVSWRFDDVFVNRFGKWLAAECDTQEKALKFILEECSEYRQGFFEDENELRSEFDTEAEEEFETDIIYYFRNNEWYVYMVFCEEFIPLKTAQDLNSHFVVTSDETDETLVTTNWYEGASGLAIGLEGNVSLGKGDEVVSDPYTFKASNFIINVQKDDSSQDYPREGIQAGLNLDNYAMNMK